VTPVDGLATDWQKRPALELLERALGYTRVALSEVGPDRAGPTPCAGWSLADLLDHMDDGLDAFLEAAGGAVGEPVQGPPRPRTDLELLRSKACHLLGVWSRRTPPVVLVGDRPVPSGLLICAAALEITVHGWDVGRATGAGPGIPAELAEALMPVAHAVVLPGDRPERFAAPVPTGAETPASGVLLGFLGRRETRA
jgi:uncharacterized protein (TIGR03086 family)